MSSEIAEIAKEIDSAENLSLLEKLDKCACQFVECYQQLLTERLLLNSCLDEGYLHLSKARSMMGCASLSITQVPNELESKVRVALNEQENEIDTDLEHKSKKFELVFVNDNAEKIIDEAGEAAKSNKMPPLPSWFGVLTPQNLKTSHKSFARSLYIATSICELQSRLESLKLTYQELMKQKK